MLGIALGLAGLAAGRGDQHLARVVQRVDGHRQRQVGVRRSRSARRFVVGRAASAPAPAPAGAPSAAPVARRRRRFLGDDRAGRDRRPCPCRWRSAPAVMLPFTTSACASTEVDLLRVRERAVGLDLVGRGQAGIDAGVGRGHHDHGRAVGARQQLVAVATARQRRESSDGDRRTGQPRRGRAVAGAHQGWASAGSLGAAAAGLGWMLAMNSASATTTVADLGLAAHLPDRAALAQRHDLERAACRPGTTGLRNFALSMAMK